MRKPTNTDGDGAGDGLVVLQDVLLVSDGLSLIVEYRGRRFGVPGSMVEPGSTVRNPGDRGVLVLDKHRARDVGLIDAGK